MYACLPTSPLGGIRCLLPHTCPQLAWNKQGFAAWGLITRFCALSAFKSLSFAGRYSWDVGVCKHGRPFSRKLSSRPVTGPQVSGVTVDGAQTPYPFPVTPNLTGLFLVRQSTTVPNPWATQLPVLHDVRHSAEMSVPSPAAKHTAAWDPLGRPGPPTMP